MRFSILCLSVLLASSVLLAQQKVVVNYNGDMIPVKKGQSPSEVIKQHSGIGARSVNAACSDQTTFGYKPADYPCDQPFVGYHKDVWGQWFIAPSDGTIDTFYFWTNDQNEMQDSSAKIRLFKSNINETSGPGHGPYKAPRSLWGYYYSTKDADQGITPFKDQSTDSVWIPSNHLNSPPDEVPSFDPLGDEIWGIGGFPVVVRMGTTENLVNSVPMMYLGFTPELQKGEAFFATIEQLGEHVDSDNDGPATWCQTKVGIESPARNWKFYEHPTAGSSGWHARAEANWVWWFAMTVTADIAPDFLSFSKYYHTVSTASRTVQAEVQDCNPGNPGNAGVASVTLSYSINSGAWTTVNMTGSGGLYEATLPGVEEGGYLKYYMTATDVASNVKTTPILTYTVIGSKNSYYSLDTTAAFEWPGISASGTRVGDGDWFNDNNTQNAPSDDGQAGPIDMGQNFYLFGDTVRYAWIGANGAVALSTTAAETLRMQNVGGSYSANWIFPGITALTTSNDIPRNMVSPFYNDLALPPKTDDQPEAHGSVYHKADGSKFIIEYDSVGNLSKLADSLISFAIVFDKADNSVTFHYKEVGIALLDSFALVGMQADTNKFFFIAKDGYPPQFRPRDGRAFRMEVIAAEVSVADGWNMLSAPGVTSNYAQDYLYPTATSDAFRYTGSYQISQTLANGPGYWMKFSGAQTVPVAGAPLTSADVSVNNLWNLIGSISEPVSTASITSTPENIVASPYYAYSGAYSEATTLTPGQAYWVKANNNGVLHLNAAGVAPKNMENPLNALNAIVITDARGRKQQLYIGEEKMLGVPAERYEMPPVPPAGGFDARFVSQRMAEVHPSLVNEELAFPISLQSAAFPLTIQWSVKNGSYSYVLAQERDGKEAKLRAMDGNGSIRVSQQSEGLTIKVRQQSSETPIAYSLEQNYPNPFNPSTLVKYSLPFESHVTLNLYNVLGQHVATMLDEVQPAGHHSFRWSAEGNDRLSLGSGVYFYRIDATSVSGVQESFSQIKKMMLVK